MSAPSDFANAAQALAAAVAAAIADPGDGIAALAALATYAPPTTAGLDVDMATMQSATGDVFRRAALTALCRVSTQYQPRSSNDAANLRQRICDLLDTEIEIAADQGQDATYQALRALRGAVVADLTARGAGLPNLVTVNVPSSVPAPVLAQRLYRDPTRADELVTRVDPVHPAFMPTQFTALSK